MKKYSFTKMNGAGNDFIVFNKQEVANLDLSPSFIQKICDRRFGIGGDGVITVGKESGYDFAMEYFNADGTTGTLCGNGARCAIRFAETTGISHSKSLKFLSGGIAYSGEILENGLIKFNLNDPGALKQNFPCSVSDVNLNTNYIHTGSPHVVYFLDDETVKESISFNSIEDFPVHRIGRAVRNADEFTPGGVNVNFLEIKDSVVHIRTYERGVENETLACGTGAVGSAIITHLQKKISPPIVLQTKGGDTLVVDFTINGDKITNVSLTGPAAINFTGTVTLS